MILRPPAAAAARPVLFLALLLCAFPAAAEDTSFSIHVRARDAAFIGTAMGGARVTIRDRQTGDILVEGVTTGESGNPKELVGDRHGRGDVLVTEDTASFDFSMDLVDPVPVTITATGPLAQPQAAVSVSEDFFLIPGKDYTKGNGILLELPGLAVDVVAPAAGKRIDFDPGTPVPVTVNVSTFSGHAIETGTLWPPERYEVEARIFKDTAPIATVPLEPVPGVPGQFYTKLKIPQTGVYSVLVTAFDPGTGEAGMDKTTMVIVDK